MGSVQIGPDPSMPYKIAVVSSSATSITAVSATAGSVTRVYKLFLVSGGTTNVTFYDGSTQQSGALPLSSGGSITLDADGTPWFVTGYGNAFVIGNSGNLQLSGTIYYTVNPWAPGI